MPSIFVSAPLPGRAVEQLREVADVTVGASGVGVRGGAFLDAAQEFDGILSLLTDTIDDGLLRRAPRVRVVANMAVGFDNVDVDACRARGVVVTNTPGVLTEATADFAFGLLLAAARRIAEADRLVRRGEFQGWLPTLLLGAQVHGTTLGLVGFGRIGQAMARRARGFGMHVLYTQRTRLAPALEKALGATYASVDDVFEGSDVVSLHCPLTAETRHIASATRLSRMRRGSILVNTARGPCVDEGALLQALRDGPLGAAALDVFEGERATRVDIAPDLLALPNVVFAPHIASADETTRASMAETAAANLLAFLRGAPPPNALR
jgi:glyoxylate reductase